MDKKNNLIKSEKNASGLISYSKLEQQDKERFMLLEIDPKRCRPWEYHNRDFAWLTKERCQDLIDSIQKSGQIEPVLVRRIENNPDYDFELICGVRRWFACSQIPNQKLLARVIVADDKTCTLLMHAENANSRDISEFERAFSFAKHMKAGIFKNQTEMAKSMGLTQGSISKMLKAAEIFEYDWIRSLFKDKLQIPIRYAYELSVLLKNASYYLLIKNETEIILKEQQERLAFLSAPNILKRLIRSVTQKTPLSTEQSILSLNNKPVISYFQDKFGNLRLMIEQEAQTLGRLAVEEACVRAIKGPILDQLFPEE